MFVSKGYQFPTLKEADAMFMSEKAPEWKDGETCTRCRVQFGMVQRKVSPVFEQRQNGTIYRIAILFSFLLHLCPSYTCQQKFRVLFVCLILCLCEWYFNCKI